MIGQFPNFFNIINGSKNELYMCIGLLLVIAKKRAIYMRSDRFVS